MIDVHASYDAPTGTVTYLVVSGREAVLIDPILDYDAAGAVITTDSVDKVLTQAQALGVRVTHVLETHVHADHLSAGDHVRHVTGASVAIGSRIVEVQATFRDLFGMAAEDANEGAFDILLDDGDTLTFGDATIAVLHTPGHTPACVSYLIDGVAFVGDTLFMPDFGTARTDFPGGDAASLYQSIQKILALPDETVLYVGHDYPSDARPEPSWRTTVRDQKAANIHVGANADEAAFVAMREARDATLSQPKLILPALQVNIRAGALPPPEAGGRRYFKLPITFAPDREA
ncbi:MAG: MBL fold metallo-hydrolase [Pseudomonadota bacterium]